MNTKQLWEQIYEGKAPQEVSWYQSRPSTSLCMFAECGLAKDSPLIDVGGGASLLVDRLLDLGYSRLTLSH